MRYFLWITTGLSLYIIFCVGLGWFWTIGVSENYERINQVLLNLSYSYIAGFVFYILIEYIPRRIAAKRAFMIWEKDLVEIYRTMSEVIAPIKMILQIDKNDEEITLDDLKNISTYHPRYEKIYCSVKPCSNIESTSDIKMVFAFHLDIREKALSIRRRIFHITRLPSALNIRHDLLEDISELEASPFFESCNSFNQTVLWEREYTIAGFDNGCYHFLKMYIKLKKYNFEKKAYKYCMLKNDEIELMEKIRTDVYKNVKNQFPLDRYTYVFNGYEYKVRKGKLI